MISGAIAPFSMNLDMPQHPLNPAFSPLGQQVAEGGMRGPAATKLICTLLFANCRR